MCRLLRQGHAYPNGSVKIAACVSSFSDENQFEMDIWAPVLPPVESYWENTTKVIWPLSISHEAFFFTLSKNKSFCMEPEMVKKVKTKKKKKEGVLDPKEIMLSKWH